MSTPSIIITDTTADNKDSSLSSSGSLETIRSGRNVFFQTTFLGEGPPSWNFVFVHGTCASSAQYYRLLDVMRKDIDSEQQQSTGMGSIQCYLYDAIGCGKSPLVRDWHAYHTDEAVLDLAAILNHRVDSNTPTILVGHSYAPTILLRYLHQQQSSSNDKGSSTSTTNIVGCIFLSSALKDGPCNIPDGGHPIFNLPVTVLKCLQPSLTKSFLASAFCHNPLYVDTKLLEEAEQACNANDMGMCKAYQRHHQFATVEEAQSAVSSSSSSSLPVLVIHGKEDGIVPLEGGMHLADVVHGKLVTVDYASHQVMEEQPHQVAKAIWEFLLTFATVAT